MMRLKDVLFRSKRRERYRKEGKDLTCHHIKPPKRRVRYKLTTVVICDLNGILPDQTVWL